MPGVSTTNLRELSMQISRLIDQFGPLGSTYGPVVAALGDALEDVDTLIREIKSDDTEE